MLACCFMMRLESGKEPACWISIRDGRSYDSCPGGQLFCPRRAHRKDQKALPSEASVCCAHPLKGVLCESKELHLLRRLKIKRSYCRGCKPGGNIWILCNIFGIEKEKLNNPLMVSRFYAVRKILPYYLKKKKGGEITELSLTEEFWQVSI